MKSGSIVTVNNFCFLDGFVDREGYKRRCIVLFEETIHDEEYVYLCPIVSQLKSFNDKPNNYYLLSMTNKCGKKFYFAKLNSVVLMKKDRILDLVDFIDLNTTKRILEHIKNNYLDYNYQEQYTDIVNKIK